MAMLGLTLYGSAVKTAQRLVTVSGGKKVMPIAAALGLVDGGLLSQKVNPKRFSHTSVGIVIEYFLDI